MKKIMDILFESEEDEVVVDAPLKKVEKTNPPVRKVTTAAKPTTVNNKDVLANRPHSKSFGIIDVDELQVKKPLNKKVLKKEKEEVSHYETQPPISPIFGIIKDHEDNVLKTPQITSGGASRIGTVLSPIYGTVANTESTNEKSADLTLNEPFDEPIHRIEPLKEDEPEFKNAMPRENKTYEDDTFVAEQAISLFDDYDKERK